MTYRFVAHEARGLIESECRVGVNSSSVMLPG
ncbi:hypothetical protein BN977_01701 [Mycolicibacterium cosmeticum]|uniref:Uncharacterized protein n=1 Tax=Mycolicibacterium cosmeticum TaxID=258533 RepID=W9AWD7_MYCCO|nr:hypothetical protein BN977_01701 [Mycolicibacterium cosmeticum]